MPLIPDLFGTLPTATVTPGTFLEGAALYDGYGRETGQCNV